MTLVIREGEKKKYPSFLPPSLLSIIPPFAVLTDYVPLAKHGELIGFEGIFTGLPRQMPACLGDDIILITSHTD